MFSNRIYGETKIVNDFDKKLSYFVYGVGIVLLSKDEGYEGVNRENNLIQIPYAESERFRLMGLKAEYKVLLGYNYSIGIHFETVIGGYEAKESD